MKLSRSTAALIALALFLTAPLAAQAAGACASQKGCAIPNLTADQSAKLAKLKVDHQKAMVQLQAAMKTKHLEFRQMMLDKADQKKLEAKIDEIAKAGADIRKSCLAHKIAVKTLLTDDQKKALEARCQGLDCGSGMSCGGKMGHGGPAGHGNGCGGGCAGHMTGKTEKAKPAASECDAESCGSKAACKK
ncbi:MAG TPA: hypothetical protein P5119_03450 [Candidatus Aminicenantes bacterium]|nr:hypothetical protein [Candidatus Aminicenantes bacterium]HRY64379.1 hypothetical protein [Candidatus Aminicenantes bacterium]HRZ71292.1 hypothetical protein [Candidatus Aminicenantes bacterium]